MVALNHEYSAGSFQPLEELGRLLRAHAGVFTGAAGIIPHQQDQVRLELHDSLNVAQGSHFVKWGGHEMEVPRDNDFQGSAAAIPLGNAVSHLPDEQQVGLNQISPGYAGYPQRANTQQQDAEKPEYSDGEGHSKNGFANIIPFSAGRREIYVSCSLLGHPFPSGFPAGRSSGDRFYQI